MTKLIERATAMLIALSLVLSSIMPAAASAQSFKDILGRGGARSEAGARKLNSTQIRDARSAQALFTSVKQTSSALSGVPASTSTEVYNPRNKIRAEFLKAELERTLDAYQDAQDRHKAGGSPVPAATLVALREAVAPFVRFLEQLARQRGRAPPVTTAVLPGTVRTFDLPGYCMDSNLASPKAGENFRLTPAKDLLPAELLPIYQALMSSPQGHDYAFQGLVRKLRNAYRSNSPVELGSETLAKLTAIYPQSPAAIEAYNRKIAKTKAARGIIDAVLPGIRRNVNSLLDTASSLSPRQMAEEVRDQIAILDAMPVQGQSNPLSAYTTLAPGVVAYSTSPRGGHSSIHIEIANTSDKPYQPSFTSWVGTSERSVQHMAIQNPAGYAGPEPGAGETSSFSFGELLSYGLDFSVLGNVKAGIQAILGYDLVTGTPANRWLEAMAIIPIVGQATKAERLVARGVLQAKHYRELIKELKGTGKQAHHLSQDAAYKDAIKHSEGLTTGLEGQAFRDVGSPHYRAHEELEKFWEPYRKGGPLANSVPTNKQYLEALERSLVKAGLDPRDARALAEQAGAQQLSKGLPPEANVPKVPGKMNQGKKR